MKERPILIVVIGYIIGILWELYLKTISIALFIVFLIIIYILLKNIKIKLKNKNIIKYIKLIISNKILIILIISMILANIITKYKNNDYENKYKIIKKSNFIAVVISDKKEKEYSEQYKIKIEEIDKNKKYRNTNLLLNIKKGQELKYGDKIKFEAEYIEPSTQRNYGGFNYKQYLKSIQIYGIVNTNSVIKIGTGKTNIFENISNKIIKKVKINLKEIILKEEIYNFFLGIILGEDTNISEDLKNNFKRSSLSHILAVSGMHVSYIILGITIILEKLKFSKKIIKIFTIIFLLFFIYLTGQSPSVKRASIMSIISIVATLIYKKSDIINNISITLLIILIQNPFSILDIGLILSFMGMMGIIFIYPKLKDYFINQENNLLIIKNKNIFEKIYLKIKETIMICVSAQIIIFPIIIINFNTISLTFLISNLLISFFIGPIIIIGFLIILLCLKFIIISKILFYVVNILLEIIIIISKFVSKLPLSEIILVTPNIIYIILFYIIILFINYIYKIKSKNNKRKYEKKILNNILKIKEKIKKEKIYIIILIIILIICIQTIKLIPKNLKIHFIDVGQGDSTLIITPHNKKILIDGGGNKDKNSFNIGEQILFPYLLDRQINKLDYIIISHFDIDHVRFYSIFIKRNKNKKCNNRKTI